MRSVKLCVCVCVLFTLTDRASNIPSNICSCQSGTWSAGQIRRTAIKLQRKNEKKNKAKMTESKEIKITKQ